MQLMKFNANAFQKYLQIKRKYRERLEEWKQVEMHYSEIFLTKKPRKVNGY